MAAQHPHETNRSKKEFKKKMEALHLRTFSAEDNAGNHMRFVQFKMWILENINSYVCSLLWDIMQP